MRVVCLQENLAKGLSAVSRVVANQSALPVLSNVLLRTDAAQLRLSATNLEIGISHWVRAKVEEHGAITVPAKLLAGLVSSLPPERVEMDVNARTKSLRVRCAHHEANIKGIDATEFPLMPDLADEPGIKLKPALLLGMIAQVTPVAAVTESRPILGCVLAKLGNGRITMVASDGFRLSVRNAQMPNGNMAAQEIIIPANALRELAHLAAAEESEIEMRVSPTRNQVLFRTTRADLLAQLLEGRFPDYGRFIPRAHGTRTILDAQELVEAVRLALFFARDAANIVQLHILPGEPAGRIMVSAASAQAGDSASELGADVEGLEEKIAFNARYLLDALGVIGTPQVILETSSPSSPAIIRPLGGADLVHVIVPIIVY